MPNRSEGRQMLIGPAKGIALRLAFLGFTIYIKGVAKIVPNSAKIVPKTVTSDISIEIFAKIVIFFDAQKNSPENALKFWPLFSNERLLFLFNLRNC